MSYRSAHSGVIAMHVAKVVMDRSRYRGTIWSRPTPYATTHPLAKSGWKARQRAVVDGNAILWGPSRKSTRALTSHEPPRSLMCQASQFARTNAGGRGGTGEEGPAERGGWGVTGGVSTGTVNDSNTVNGS